MCAIATTTSALFLSLSLARSLFGQAIYFAGMDASCNASFHANADESKDFTILFLRVNYEFMCIIYHLKPFRSAMR